MPGSCSHTPLQKKGSLSWGSTQRPKPSPPLKYVQAAVAFGSVSIIGFNWYINSTLNNTDTESGVYPTSATLQYLLSELPGLQEKGISGTYYVSPTSIPCFSIFPGEQADIENANSVWGPILERAQRFPGITPFQIRPFEFNRYREFFEGTYGPLVPHPTTPEFRRDRGLIPYDSRLLSAEHLTSPDIIEALQETGGGIDVQFETPGQIFGNENDTAANS